MAEEQLTLVDGMSASLRRIYQEAERLNKRMLTLKTNIKSLEKPASLSFLRRELKETEKQAQQTERAIRAMKNAEALNAKYGAFTVGRNGAYYVNGVPVSNINRGYMAESYIRNSYGGTLRRNRLLWENGRFVNGMSFDDRVARLHPFRNFAHQLPNIQEKFGILTGSSNNLISSFTTLASKILLFGEFISRLKDISENVFIRPQSQYISNLTRTALTNDRNKTPVQMMNELYDTASRTRAPADATFMLYNRIALSGVKASNERIRRFVESFNKVTAISGTSGQENRAVMLQLAQGIGSNRLGGDEFRSISEQAPLFKFMLAKGLGVNPGDLKEMGAQGKLTAEAILSGLEKVQDEIDLIFKDAPLTIEQTLTIMQNEWQKIITKQMSGYIAIRDLLKDVIIWMRSAKGQETISIVVQAWNRFLIKTTTLVRKVAPFILWLITHIKQVAISIGLLLLPIFALKTAFNGLQLIINGFKLYEWFMSASEGAVLLKTALQGINSTLLVTVSRLGLVLGMVGLLLASKEKIANTIVLAQDNAAQKQELKGHMDQWVHNWTRNHLYANEQAMWSDKNFAKAYIEEENKFRQIIKEGHQEARDSLSPDYEFNKKAEDYQRQLEKITGMADSSKNVPTVGKVNEVGKVNDKISIDNDGIEMMKSIAERQWVMQNEVIVPQNVPITITKEVDMDETKIAEAITGGMKIAVASSMRGATA